MQIPKNLSRSKLCRLGTLRFRLMLLVFATMLPLLAFAVLMITWLGRQERATFERGATERTRALVTAVDAELQSSIATLEALASSRHFDTDDLSGFNEEAARVLNTQPGWFTIILISPNGQQLMNLGRPFGSELPAITEWESFHQVLQIGKPVVGQIAHGPDLERYAFPVHVPVARGGVIKYVLTAVVNPNTISELLLAQKLPPDWIGVVLDRNRRAVARSVDPEWHVGQPTSESLKAALDRAGEGWFRGISRDERDVYTPYNRSSFSGWTVAIGIPAAAVDASFRRSFLFVTSFGLIVFSLGIALALVLSKRTASSIESLSRMAEDFALDERKSSSPASTGIAEVERVREALAIARRIIQERSRERDRAERILRIESAVNRILAESLKLRDASPKILQIVCELGGWDVGAIWEMDRTANELACVEFWHLPSVELPDFEAATRGSRFALGTALLARVWSGGEALWVEDVTREKDFVRGPAALKAGFHSACCFPIRLGLAVFAVIECFSRESRQQDGDVLQVLTGIGRQLGQFIERKHAEEALRESEEQFRSTFENAPIGMAHVGLDGRWLRVNNTLCKIAGYSHQELLAMTFADITHPDDLETSWAHVEKLLAGDLLSYSLEKRYVRKDGSLVWAEITVSLRRNTDGRPMYLIGAIEDISGRKAAQEALREADRRKDEFLAVLGHELRNPLGVINTVVQLLRRDRPTDAKLEAYRDTIELEVNQMARLLNDLLDISRIGRGLIRLKKEPCDLAEIVRQVAESHRPMLQDGGLEFALRAPRGPVWVMGDRTRLGQIVGNLLQNANKFTDRNGRVDVELRGMTTENGSLLTVRDSGIGMEPQLVSRLFEPFVQADKSLDRSQGGLGLGLALVRRLVELHGGTVRASSSGPGKGSEFTVSLPLMNAPVFASTAKEAPIAVIRSRCVLIIEDNLTAAQLLKAFLSKGGHIVEVALSGLQGIQVARRFQPEVVLCDIGLPELDGYAVARALRQEPKLKGAYLIAVSGYGQDADHRRALDAGFDSYFTKPIDLQALERLLGNSIVYEQTPGKYRASASSVIC